MIKSDWKIEKNSFLYNVSIPANTTATIYIPKKNAKNISESRRPIKKLKGVEFLRMESGAAVYKIGSGKYEFLSEQ